MRHMGIIGISYTNSTQPYLILFILFFLARMRIDINKWDEIWMRVIHLAPLPSLSNGF